MALDVFCLMRLFRCGLFLTVTSCMKYRFRITLSCLAAPPVRTPCGRIIVSTILICDIYLNVVQLDVFVQYYDCRKQCQFEYNWTSRNISKLFGGRSQHRWRNSLYVFVVLPENDYLSTIIDILLFSKNTFFLCMDYEHQSYQSF